MAPLLPTGGLLVVLCVTTAIWVCPRARWLAVATAQGTQQAQVLLHALVAIVGVAGKAGGDPLHQQYPMEIPWWCYLCLVPWVVHPEAKWVHVATGGTKGMWHPHLVWPPWVPPTKWPVGVGPSGSPIT